MKRITLAVSLLVVVGGTASAAMLIPPPAPVPTRLALPQTVSLKTLPPAEVVRPASKVIESNRAPVPLVRTPQQPVPQVAALTVPPISPVEQSAVVPTLPAARTEPAKASIESNPDKVIRDLTSEGSCKGRTLTSVRVEPDGKVVAEC